MLIGCRQEGIKILIIVYGKLFYLLLLVAISIIIVAMKLKKVVE